MPDTDVFACHADTSFDFVVIGLNVFVRYWPIVAITVVGTSFEIKIAVTRNAASPHKRLPTDDLGTHPVVGLPCWSHIWMLAKIGEEILGVLTGNARKEL